MLFRVVVVSKAVGPTGRTVSSIAQILGASERNNRRDGLTAGLLFHGGEILQVIEGERPDLDRMLKRVAGDVRHTDVCVIEDRPVMHRRFHMPIEFCQTDTRLVETLVGSGLLSDQTAETLELLMTECGAKAA